MMKKTITHVKASVANMICPNCKGRRLRLHGPKILHCSLCGSIYLKSSSVALKRLNVDPADSCSEYPDVIFCSDFPYCDCSLQAYIETGMPNGGIFGPRYCPKHNVIILEVLLRPDDIPSIAEITVEIINHETLHWILCRDFGESVSTSFDKPRARNFVNFIST